jgi:hypothetical protein
MPVQGGVRSCGLGKPGRYGSSPGDGFVSELVLYASPATTNVGIAPNDLAFSGEPAALRYLTRVESMAAGSSTETAC